MKKELKETKNTRSKEVGKTSKEKVIASEVTPQKSITLKLPKFSSFKFKALGNIKTLVLVLIVGLLFGYLITIVGNIPSFKNITVKEAKQKTETYLGTLPLESFSVKEVKDSGEVYTVELEVNGQPYTSYMSKDGKLLFQGGIDLTQPVEENTADKQAQQQPQELPRSDKPSVELFVMSHCPYGTQMEKGILPVVDALGDKIDFEVKFVDYAMHGEKEVVEQMNQYCIQKMGKATYLSYLKCFLNNADSTACVGTAGVNLTTLKACTTETDTKFGVMAGFKDKAQWKGNYPPFNTHKEDNVKYNVQGSPTLIINGVESQSGRDSASLLGTICSAFNNAPEACSIILDSATPTPGFGSGTTTTDSSGAQCN